MTVRTTASEILETAGCPECDGRLDDAKTETVCNECGLVVDEDNLNRGADWYRDEEDSGIHVGAPRTETRHDKGLSTEIGRRRDGKGNKLSAKQRRQMGRLRKQHRRSKFRTHKERNTAYGLGEVRRLTSTLELSDSLRDRSCRIFRAAHEADLVEGRSLDAMAAATVYAACREAGTPVTPDRVAEAARTKQSTFLHTFGLVCRELDDVAPGVYTPADHIPRLASAVDASERVEKKAHELACQAADAGIISGMSPSGFAAACLYAAGRYLNSRIRQVDIAEEADVCVVTVRNHWNKVNAMHGGDV